MHLGVNMRSNDIIFGLCNDVFTFSLFQQLMLNELNSRGAKVTLGTYNHHAGSLHLYERHYSMASKILLEKRTEPISKFILNPEFRSWEAISVHSMPIDDLEKEQIKQLSRKASEVFFK